MKKFLLGLTFFLSLVTGLAFSFSVQAALPERVPLKNPLATRELADSGDVEELLAQRLSDLLTTMFGLLGVISLFPVVIGGIQLIASRGSSSMVESGKKTLTWGVIGLIVGLLGVIIFNFILTSLVQT